MVKIYSGTQIMEIEGAKLRAMTAKEAVSAASKPGEKSGILTRCGRPFAQDSLLAEVGDDDVLRIVHKELVSNGVNQEDVMNVEKNFHEVHRLMKHIQDDPNDDGISFTIFLQKVHDYLQKEGKETMLAKEEDLRKDAVAMTILSDSALLAAFFLDDTPEMLAFHKKHPLISKLAKEITMQLSDMQKAWRQEMVAQAQNNRQAQMDLLNQLIGYQANFGLGRPQGGQNQGQAASTAQRQNPITPEMFFQALTSARGQNQSAGPANPRHLSADSGATTSNLAASNPNTAASSDVGASGQAADPRLTTYRTQLQQLHEFGFADDAINLNVLEASAGDVNMALEMLTSMLE